MEVDSAVATANETSVNNTDVVIETLENAYDLRNVHVPWNSNLILVDEASLSTEPMSFIPYQMFNADAHVVFFGDHMQLAPTVFIGDCLPIEKRRRK